MKKRLTELLLRGLFLRCPVCGQGKLFRSVFGMYEDCPVCHFHYEREPGYFSSAMAIDLVLSELIVTAIVIPLAVNRDIPLMSILLWTLPLAFILPVLFYRHSRGLWMSMDHYLHPTAGRPFMKAPVSVEEPAQKE